MLPFHGYRSLYSSNFKHKFLKYIILTEFCNFVYITNNRFRLYPIVKSAGLDAVKSAKSMDKH